MDNLYTVCKINLILFYTVYIYGIICIYVNTFVSECFILEEKWANSSWKCIKSTTWGPVIKLIYSCSEN